MELETQKISDLGLAAALSTMDDIKIADTQKEPSGRMYFVFQYAANDAANFDVLVDNYWHNHFDVDARSYSDAIKMLKSMIYAG